MITRVSNILALLLVLALPACGRSPQASSSPPPPTGMINPGDKIGDFLITTGGDKDVTYTWALDCTDGENDATCNAKVGAKVNVSWGVYAPRGRGLDDLWAGHTYKMLIGDRPVNLEAFAPISVYHPEAGKMRHWNVVVVASKPGKLTVHSSTVVDGEPQEGTFTYIFSAP